MSENILICLPHDLPGIVMAEPALRALKENLPKAKIHVGTSTYWAPLVEKCPGVDSLLIYNHRSPLSVFTFMKHNLYRGILFESSFSTALWLRLSGIRKRVGFKKLHSYFLLNRQVKKMPTKYKHTRVRHMVELIRYFGCHVDDRVPRWGSFSTQNGHRLLFTQGLHEKINSKTSSLWQNNGFDVIDKKLLPSDLYEALCHAQIVVGPPDSPVTLAQALGIPTIRLTQGKRPRQDEYPGVDVCVAKPDQHPKDILNLFPSL